MRTAILSVIVVVGCTSLSSRSGHSFEQKGQVVIAAGEEKDIPFKTKFASTPEITCKDDSVGTNLQVLERKPDHFRVRNDNFDKIVLNWTAKGERASP